MTDLPLFDHSDRYPASPGYRKSGGDTSKAAAASMACHTARLQKKILGLIEASIEGLTSDELCILADLGPQTVSARLRELVLLNLIHDTGERRETRSGRSARVYKTGSSS